MDRSTFKRPFSTKGNTPYECPSCGKGTLRIKKDTFQFFETAESRKAKSHDAWFPDWIEYRYCCLMECNSCKDIVSSTGNGSVQEDYGYDEHGEPEMDYVEYFMPKYFVPHLRPFNVPHKVPSVVSDEINYSFAVLFADPPAAANHIRISLENLLTHLKIKRFVTHGGKRNFLSLHRRIDLLPAKYGHIKDLFLAIKWLGNAGSHSSSAITVDDVLDCYDLMIELLAEIFDNRRKNAKKLAKKINRRKGPK